MGLSTSHAAVWVSVKRYSGYAETTVSFHGTPLDHTKTAW